MLAKRPYGWKPVLGLPAVYVGLTRNRATRGERSRGTDLSARGPSDDDLRMWPQSMAPRDIEHLTSFRACEMLRMFKGCYDEETGEFDGAKLAGFRTKIELQALDALRQWDLESTPPIHRPTGKGITVEDLKRIMGSRGLGIGTSEDSCAVARKPLRNQSSGKSRRPARLNILKIREL